MNLKTMEGIVGAKTNIDLVNTPMRVYKEARRKGDTAVMERAMGYAIQFADRAEEYKAEADEGMKEEAKEAREKAEAGREEAIEKRKEEREKMEERIAEGKEADTLEVSEEGKELLKDTMDLTETKTDTGKDAVTYTKTGEVGKTEQRSSIFISV